MLKVDTDLTNMTEDDIDQGTHAIVTGLLSTCLNLNFVSTHQSELIKNTTNKELYLQFGSLDDGLIWDPSNDSVIKKNNFLDNNDSRVWRRTWKN